MRNRECTGWFEATGAALLVLLALGCGSREAPAPDESAALPEEPPPGVEEMPVAEQEPEPDAESGLEVSFGLRLGEGGAIASPVVSFGQGDRVCVGATLPSAASGDALGIRWYDAVGAERGSVGLALTGDPPKGALCLPGSEGLGLGSYSLEFDLSGRPVGDASFTVADSREVARRGGA